MKKEIMILGVYHLDNPNNGDLHRFESNDIKSAKRQAEIQDVIKGLSAFKPTKIALEWEKEQTKEVNQDYQNYLHGRFELSTNEKHQIGFKLANKLEHETLHCVNWNKAQGHVPFLFQWLSENDCSLFNQLNQEIEIDMKEQQMYLASHSIKEFILRLNQKEYTLKDHSVYMKLALIHDGETPIGAQWVTQYWYYRNRLIYKNLIDLFETNEDRILLIIGAAHVHLLTQFFEEVGEYEVVEVSTYLI